MYIQIPWLHNRGYFGAFYLWREGSNSFYVPVGEGGEWLVVLNKVDKFKLLIKAILTNE